EQIQVIPFKTAYASGQYVEKSHLAVYTRNLATGNMEQVTGGNFELEIKSLGSTGQGLNSLGPLMPPPANPMTVAVKVPGYSAAAKANYNIWVDAPSVVFTPMLIAVPMKTNYRKNEKINPVPGIGVSELVVYKSGTDGSTIQLEYGTAAPGYRLSAEEIGDPTDTPFPEARTYAIRVIDNETGPEHAVDAIYTVEVSAGQTLGAPSLTLDFPLGGNETRGHTQTGYHINPPGVGDQPTSYEIWYLEGDANRESIIALGTKREVAGIMEGLLENIYGSNGVFTGRNIYFVVVGKRDGWEPGISAPVCWTPLAGDIIWLNERLPPARTDYWSFEYIGVPLPNPYDNLYDKTAPVVTSDSWVNSKGLYGPFGSYSIERSGVKVTGETIGKYIEILTGRNINVTLDNAKINILTGRGRYAPMRIGRRDTGASADVILTLRGDNVLKRHHPLYGGNDVDVNDKAGLEVNYNSSVEIQGSGSLTAIGGSRAAGIGASSASDMLLENCGNIKIVEGNIYAIGGSGAAGIGVAYGAPLVNNGRTITITGGTVFAFGGPTGNYTLDGGAGIDGRGDITITNGVVYAFGGRKAERDNVPGPGIRTTGTVTVGVDAAVFAFKDADPDNKTSSIDATTTHTNGLLFKNTTGMLKSSGNTISHPRTNALVGRTMLNYDAFIPPSTGNSADWKEFWDYVLDGRNVFPKAARDELMFRTTGSKTDFEAAYPNIEWKDRGGGVTDFHSWPYPAYLPSPGIYELDLNGTALDLRGKTLAIIPGGTLEFRDTRRPNPGSSASSDPNAWADIDSDSTFTGKLTNRDTPTKGFVMSGKILGFNRKEGYNGGPNLLPAPGYFFRDALYYDRGVGDRILTKDVYNWGNAEPYCGYVDYTGREGDYSYYKNYSDGLHKPGVNSVPSDKAISPGEINLSGYYYGHIDDGENKGYNFFDKFWGEKVWTGNLNTRPYFEWFVDNVDNPYWNLFAFLVEEPGNGMVPITMPAEGIFNMRLTEMRLTIPGVYAWVNPDIVN
ncbi:MAG: hypothetical protein LBG76_06660, partial [Treponema sp.]|nr:hypothetical protein [Treponema sp.]